MKTLVTAIAALAMLAKSDWTTEQEAAYLAANPEIARMAFDITSVHCGLNAVMPWWEIPAEDIKGHVLRHQGCMNALRMHLHPGMKN